MATAREFEPDVRSSIARCAIETRRYSKVVSNLGGQTIVAGLHSFSTAVVMTTDATLTGGPNDVWIFQIPGAFSVTAQMALHLVGGARPEHVYWVADGAVSVGAGAHLEGVVISQAAITTGAGATVQGRLFGATAVTLGASSIVTEPAL